MARVKRGVESRRKHKKVLKLKLKDTEELEAGLLRLQSKQSLELVSMLTETEELKKETSGLYGL